MKGLSGLLSCLFFLVFNFNFSFGQPASVKFEVKIPAESLSKDSSIFITRSFNCWNPHDSLYIMQKTGSDLYSLVIPVFGGKEYEYKYTLGDWGSVETSADNADIPNRQIISLNGLTVKDTVVKWKSPETAKPNDTTFEFNKEQMDEMSKLKEAMGKKLEMRVKNTLGTLKKALENMLSEKPSMKLRKKYHKEVVNNMNHVLTTITDALWKVSSMMTPEKKKAILKVMNNPEALGDVFGLMTKALNLPQK